MARSAPDDLVTLGEVLDRGAAGLVFDPPDKPGYERRRDDAASHGLGALPELLAAKSAVPGLVSATARAGYEVAR